MGFYKEAYSKVRKYYREEGISKSTSLFRSNVFFLIIIYCYLQEGIAKFNGEAGIALGIIYIIFLSVFMDKKALECEEANEEVANKNMTDTITHKMEIKQNKISWINVFKNIKK